MREPLQAWYDRWRAEYRDTNLIYARDGNDKPRLDQVHVVRDELAPLVWADTPFGDLPQEPPPRDDRPLTAWIIGEHRSKSVRLPVYSIERPDVGIQFVLRYNFYDWKLSVISEQSIDDPLFPYLFYTTPPVEPEYTGNQLHPVYFEGFPRELVFGYQSQNQHRWSASLGGGNLRMTILLCMKQLGVVKPFEQLTRAAHRAKLDAERAALKRLEARRAAKPRRHCDCGKLCTDAEWDHLYSSCHRCAVESSLR